MDYLTKYAKMVNDYDTICTTILPDNIKISFLETALIQEESLSVYNTMWKQNRIVAGNANATYTYDDYYQFLKDCMEAADLTTPLKMSPRHAFHLNIGDSDGDDSTVGYYTDVSQACDMSEGDMYSAFVADQIRKQPSLSPEFIESFNAFEAEQRKQRRPRSRTDPVARLPDKLWNEMDRRSRNGWN